MTGNFRRMNLPTLATEGTGKHVIQLQEWSVFTLEPTKKIWTAGSERPSSLAEDGLVAGRADVILDREKERPTLAIVDYKLHR